MPLSNWLPAFPGLSWLPYVVALWMLLTFLSSYVTAVVLGHVVPALPYISDTGTLPPESCVFGQMLNIAALLVGFLGYSRYKQLCHYQPHPLVNKLLLFVVVIAAFGASLVANFQEKNVIVVHVIGAFAVFGGGNLYCLVQTFVSYRLVDRLGTKRTCHIRAVLSVLQTVLLTIMSTLTSVSFSRLREWDPDADPMHWVNTWPGYDIHIAAATAEWLLGIVLVLYFLTFSADFRLFSLDLVMRAANDEYVMGVGGDSLSSLANREA